MIRKTLLTLAIISALAGSAAADGNCPLIEPQTAQHLISRVLDIRPENVSIGSITYGSLHNKDGFEHHGACKIIAIVTVYENGLTMRRVRDLNFLWSTQNGWFYQEVINQRGRDELRIFSELNGDFTVK